MVGAGVVALGAGSALPAPTGDQAVAALGAKDGGAVDAFTGQTTGEQPGQLAADRQRTLSARASRAQRRTGVGDPTRLPEWVVPANGPLSSLFGARWGTHHYGIDIAAPYGSTVRAASAGKVVRAGWYGGYGMIVIIDHGNGVTTRYGHNSQLLVEEGDVVEAGQPISKVGSTGYSTGPHCHFEVRIDDKPLDPIPFMRDRGIDFSKVNTGL
jgi:murein DD-endopeptidase MepM/ murein hydrolase activator NlpD